MSVVFLGRDLIFASRVAAAAERHETDFRRVDTPADLPPPAGVRLLLVDWAERQPEWAAAIAAWSGGGAPRVIVFGPHTDLEAHAAARDAGIGPMWARSKLFSSLDALLG
ncbi:MAG TPA: hypothetical protein VFK93_00630 [Candidatus Limnocylindria bacterium]|nr:hypothetical protein [Candidatus Limnocylindria bacterium]